MPHTPSGGLLNPETLRVTKSSVSYFIFHIFHFIIRAHVHTDMELVYPMHTFFYSSREVSIPLTYGFSQFDIRSRQLLFKYLTRTNYFKHLALALNVIHLPPKLIFVLVFVKNLHNSGCWLLQRTFMLPTHTAGMGVGL